MAKITNAQAAFVGGMMKGVGVGMENMDANNTGLDDLIGVILDAGGDAVAAFANGNGSKVERALTAIESGIAAYRATQATATQGNAS